MTMNIYNVLERGQLSKYLRKIYIAVIYLPLPLYYDGKIYRVLEEVFS